MWSTLRLQQENKTHKPPQQPKRAPTDSMRIVSALLVLPAASSMASSGSLPFGSPCIRSSSQAHFAYHCPATLCKCRSLQYIMPLSLLLPSALLPLPPHERAMDLQLEVLGGGGREGSGVIFKTVVCKSTSHQILRASYRVSGRGEQCQIVSGSTNFPSQLFALYPATGCEARFFRIHNIRPQVFGRVSGRGEHARLLQDTQSCLLATSVHTKPTFISPPVGHAPDCGPPRELLLCAALRPPSGALALLGHDRPQPRPLRLRLRLCRRPPPPPPQFNRASTALGRNLSRT